MGRRRQSPRALTYFLLGLGSGLGGCAFSYTDANGDRHAIGFVDITVRAPAAPETLAGDIVELTSLGLSVGQNAQGGYITAGFNRQTTAALRDNTTGTTTTVLAKTCVASSGWIRVSAGLTAGHSYTLTLTSHDDNYPGDATYTLFDDVSVS